MYYAITFLRKDLVLLKINEFYCKSSESTVVALNIEGGYSGEKTDNLINFEFIDNLLNYPECLSENLISVDYAMDQLFNLSDSKVSVDQDLFEDLFNGDNMVVSTQSDQIDSKDLDLFLNKEFNCESTINLSHILLNTVSSQGDSKMSNSKDFSFENVTFNSDMSSNDSIETDKEPAKKENKKKRRSSPSDSCSTEELARFGNKYVKKYTNEYVERRVKNNVAVKKCRQKINKIQEERETRLKKLSDDNRRLNNTVESLTKELNVLKNIFLQMNPNAKLPTEIEDKLQRLENTLNPSVNNF